GSQKEISPTDVGLISFWPLNKIWLPEWFPANVHTSYLVRFQAARRRWRMQRGLERPGATYAGQHLLGLFHIPSGNFYFLIIPANVHTSYLVRFGAGGVLSLSKVVPKLLLCSNWLIASKERALDFSGKIKGLLPGVPGRIRIGGLQRRSML
ncbi:MAG: hypothetical protein J6M56_12290, partial [Clostridia bacterium]|nr:hypothetical protein [Clostridia bacterium]